MIGNLQTTVETDVPADVDNRRTIRVRTCSMFGQLNRKRHRNICGATEMCTNKFVNQKIVAMAQREITAATAGLLDAELLMAINSVLDGQRIQPAVFRSVSVFARLIVALTVYPSFFNFWNTWRTKTSKQVFGSAPLDILEPTPCACTLLGLGTRSVHPLYTASLQMTSVRKVSDQITSLSYSPRKKHRPRP